MSIALEEPEEEEEEIEGAEGVVMDEDLEGMMEEEEEEELGSDMDAQEFLNRQHVINDMIDADLDGDDD